jgi:hypothetical protein
MTPTVTGRAPTRCDSAESPGRDLPGPLDAALGACAQKEVGAAPSSGADIATPPLGWPNVLKGSRSGCRPVPLRISTGVRQAPRLAGCGVQPWERARLARGRPLDGTNRCSCPGTLTRCCVGLARCRTTVTGDPTMLLPNRPKTRPLRRTRPSCKVQNTGLCTATDISNPALQTAFPMFFHPILRARPQTSRTPHPCHLVPPLVIARLVREL